MYRLPYNLNIMNEMSQYIAAAESGTVIWSTCIPRIWGTIIIY